MEADASAAETARFIRDHEEAEATARAFALEAFHRAEVAAQLAELDARVAAEDPPRTPSPPCYGDDVPWSSEKPPT